MARAGAPDNTVDSVDKITATSTKPDPSLSVGLSHLLAKVDGKLVSPGGKDTDARPGECVRWKSLQSRRRQARW